MERMKTSLKLTIKGVYQYSPSRHIKNKYRKRVAYKREKTIWDVPCFEERLTRTKKDESYIPESWMSTNRGSECDNSNNVVHTAGGGGGESASNSTSGFLRGPGRWWVKRERYVRPCQKLNWTVPMRLNCLHFTVPILHSITKRITTMGVAEVGGTRCRNHWEQYGTEKPMDHLKGTSIHVKSY